MASDSGRDVEIDLTGVAEGIVDAFRPWGKFEFCLTDAERAALLADIEAICGGGSG